ncbi:MAG: Transcriptional regulator [Acidimicrobiales bacterium]|nr:Transcriptional regulator [Acidimicrobiales bacterium]
MTRVGVRRRARKGEGELLHAEILDATERLLVATASSEAVSIRAVADAVGVTPPSIYRHFPDKAHLLFEVCTRSFNRLADAMAAVPIGDDPFGALVRQAEAYVRFGVEHPEHYRIMFMDRIGLPPEQYEAEMTVETSAFGRLMQTVEAIVATGQVREELLADGVIGLGLQLWAGVHGITSLLIAKPEAPWPAVERVIAAQVALVTHGLLRAAA